jgi:hypothetical protein
MSIKNELSEQFNPTNDKETQTIIDRAVDLAAAYSGQILNEAIVEMPDIQAQNALRKMQQRKAIKMQLFRRQTGFSSKIMFAAIALMRVVIENIRQAELMVSLIGNMWAEHGFSVDHPFNIKYDRTKLRITNEVNNAFIQFKTPEMFTREREHNGQVNRVTLFDNHALTELL